MTIRKLLVPLTGTPRDSGALALSALVARTLDAHVEGLFVRPDPTETLPFMGEGVAGPVIQDIINAAREAADLAAGRARQALTDVAASYGLSLTDTPHGPGAPSMSFADDMGPFAGVVGSHAILSDLVVFENQEEDDGAYGIADALQECLMSRGRPILLAPATVPASIGQSVTIGWDGSAEAARSVREAMPFLTRAQRIHILNVTSDRKDTRLTQSLAAYLTYHGLSSVEHIVDPQGRPIGQTLLDEAHRSGSDLLVIGGYGHSRIREMLLGGATRHVLSHTTLPVLMAH